MKSNLDPAYIKDVRQEYGRWIRKIRERKGLTQEELALRIGIDRTTIIKLEKGRWNFGIDTVSILAYHLDFYPMFLDKQHDPDLLSVMVAQFEKIHGPKT